MKAWYLIFCITMGTIVGCVVANSKEPHQCQEKEYKEAFCKCNSERAKVREILKGDSLKTLLYW